MPIQVPHTPTTIEETGIGSDLLLKLAAKTFQVHGTMSPSQISAEMKLPIAIVSQLLKELQRLQFIESKGLSGSDMRSEIRYSLGGDGTYFAEQAFSQSQYVGPAPINLQSWVEQITAQSIANDRVTRNALKQAFSHLILPEDLVDLLGPAVNSAKSILLYGDPGNGKTSIAEAVGSAFVDHIYIPHCFEVGGQIINLFDPTLHRPIESDESTQTLSKPPFDQRWKLCRRPFVLTGGELNLDMLDLSYHPVSKFYEAPLHLKAIGGVFVVDDFGRQRTDPQSVLNRWIVPLERGYDFLTLHTGKKFSVPFDQLAIFSTNIPPNDLADPGALRRLYYKIKIPTPSETDFRQIFENISKFQNIPFLDDVFESFFERHYANGKAVPAGHHPKYIIDFISSVCRFRDEPLRMDSNLLDAGWKNLNA